MTSHEVFNKLINVMKSAAPGTTARPLDVTLRDGGSSVGVPVRYGFSTGADGEQVTFTLTDGSSRTIALEQIESI